MKKYILFVTLLFSLKFTAQNEVKPFMPEVFGKFFNARDMAISPDGTEMYFTYESNKKEFSSILYMQKTEKGWSASEVASFSGKYRDLEPFFSADGLKLYFSSARPLSVTANKSKDVDIWFVERKNKQAAWSEAINMGTAINTDKDEYYPSVALSGNIYFTRMADDNHKEDIFISRYEKQQYTIAQALNDSINSTTYEFNAFVAPDESFIIFTSYGRADDMGGSDMYISVKNKSGEFTKAQHMGKQINSNKIDYCPFVDLKNHVLYFTSERNNVPTEFAERQNLQNLQKALSQYSNGSDRIYSVAFDVNKYLGK
jgi:hypothetical protein